ncbi:23166_t:CDS:2, partial [Racocetra persica]
LAWGTDDRSLRSRFEEYGNVEDAVVIRDRDTATLLPLRDFQNKLLEQSHCGYKDANLSAIFPFPIP